MQKTSKLKLLIDLYVTFFKLGCFSFGGGYAMVPLIERESVEVKKWIDRGEMVDIFAVAQSIPGAIAMNASAFVGYKLLKLPGALVALFGNLTPPILIVLTLSVLFSQFSDYPVVDAAFKGIRPAIIGLIAYAGLKMGKTAIVDKTGVVLMVMAFIGAMVFDLHPIIVIIFGAVAGLVLTALQVAVRSRQNTRFSAKDGE